MKYIKLFENNDTRYIIVGYSNLIPNAIYIANEEGGITMRVKDKEITDDSMERIFTSRKDAEKARNLIMKIYDDRNEIIWYIEDYEDYELKYRTTKKYNL